MQAQQFQTFEELGLPIPTYIARCNNLRVEANVAVVWPCHAVEFMVVAANARPQMFSAGFRGRIRPGNQVVEPNRPQTCFFILPNAHVNPGGTRGELFYEFVRDYAERNLGPTHDFARNRPARPPGGVTQIGQPVHPPFAPQGPPPYLAQLARQPVGQQIHIPGQGQFTILPTPQTTAPGVPGSAPRPAVNAPAGAPRAQQPPGPTAEWRHAGYRKFTQDFPPKDWRKLKSIGGRAYALSKGRVVEVLENRDWPHRVVFTPRENGAPRPGITFGMDRNEFHAVTEPVDATGSPGLRSIRPNHAREADFTANDVNIMRQRRPARRPMSVEAQG